MLLSIILIKLLYIHLIFRLCNSFIYFNDLNNFAIPEEANSIDAPDKIISQSIYY